MKEKRFYKKYEELPQGYAAQLCEYLKVHTMSFFDNRDNKAKDIRDYEKWPDEAVDRTHLVMFGEIMLVDLEMPECDHAYVICEVTKRKHKLASGRLVNLKPLKSVLPIVDIPNHFWRNGYFMLPVLTSEEQ
jgi:hypothetical protein